MDNVTIMPVGSMGRDFIPKEYLPEGQDEYYLRNSQLSASKKQWRHLRAHEVELLVKNGNYSDNWDEILVTDEFDPGQIRNTEFFGRIRIGRVQEAILEHHDLQMPAGITNSRIVACDIGDDVAIHDVRYLAHYITGDRCILANIDEMHTTNHAKFGNGIIKDGESEDVRVWLDLMNEIGCRRVIPFNGMITADAYLWARYREDTALQNKLKEITQNRFDNRRGYYGTVGDQCVIKNSRIIKDVQVGTHCYVKGANKLKNLTINSTEAETTQIGEGVELVNGIVGFGCHIFYGCKAVRFIMGNNTNLKYGARLLNSFLGDNATVSCCEILNNLIFPAHEQHHNNSFLIATLVQGQSNVAAGATIGSNHNSRANDNEVRAGRGFWPGLCASVKHSCRFASFILLAKADYPAEMNIPLPFSLLNNNTSSDQLEVMPAYWWLYNMYALARNTWKFKTRDKRKTKVQNIEFDSLAPDTVEEIIKARRLLEIWTAKASLSAKGKAAEGKDEEELAKIGQELLQGPQEQIDALEVLGENMEKSKRKVVILKPYEGYRAYGQMLHYYATKNLMEYLENQQDATFSSMCKALSHEREQEWVNLGGQLMPAGDVDQIRSDIGTGQLKSWDEIHQRYDTLWEDYPLAKQRHAFATLCQLYGGGAVTKDQWGSALGRAMDIQELIRDEVHTSRKKDFDNPFRQATYRNLEEMTAAIGTVEDNSFVKQVRDETEEFSKRIEEIKKRG
jgi:NDP-sugar pyrophosphorylase family protein